jgi:hypothetical protein
MAMIKKAHYCLLFIILGSVALNFLNSPLSGIFSDDKEIFKYAGLVIYKGGVPYRDIFDHKPPLIFFLNSFDWYVSPWFTWLLDTLLVLFATLLFYWLCRKNGLAWPWFLPAIFNLLIRYSLVSFGNGMTREYTAAFLLIFFCVMQGSARYKYYILGLLTGLTFWMQQDALFTLAPFFFYAVLVKEVPVSGKTEKRILSITAGVLTISLPLLIYFYSHNSLSYLWKDAFLFNLNAPGVHVNLFEKIKSIKHALHESEFEMAFYTALILGIASLFLKNKKPVLLNMALLALVFSFAGEFISGRLSAGNAFIYYLLPLASTIPILVYLVFIGSPVSFLQDKNAQIILYLVLSATLFLGTLRFAAGFRFSSEKQKWFAGIPEIEYLDSQALDDYQLFVFDDSNLIYLYNKHKILAPSPWIYQYFWNWSADWDKDYKIFHSIIQNLQSHKTRYILDCSEARNDIKNKTVYIEWNQFLQSHYMLLMKDSSNRKLWRIQ